MTKTTTKFQFSLPIFGLLLGVGIFILFLNLPTFEGFKLLFQAKFPTQSPENIAIAANSMQRAFALLLLMITWWLTEAVPIPVTALVPAVLIPFLDIQKLTESGVKKVGNVEILSNYADPIVFLFLGGFVLASAMTYHHLDRRITFKLLSYPMFTKSPKQLILGIMIATAFTSMWINNTAVAAMLMPIGIGIARGTASLSGQAQGSKSVTNFAACIAISIAYSASIGGIGTIVGSTPNGIAVSMLKQQNIANMTFASWLPYGIPILILVLTFAYFYLSKVLPFKDISFENVSEKVNEELRKLGKMKSGESRTLYVFVITALCWLVLPFLKGVFPPALDKIITAMDTWVVAMISALALFFIPEGKSSEGTRTTAQSSEGTRITVQSSDGQATIAESIAEDDGKVARLVSWEHAQKSVDWGALILFGGGLAMSKILFETQSVEFIAQQIKSLLGEPSLILYVFVLTFFVNFLTEVSSNTAVASMMTPIAISVAISSNFSPIPMTLAIAFGASMAFMLPIATPPNAIAYGTGLFKLKQMARTGFVLNIVSTIIITLVIMLNEWLF
jgi:sodium-dependent dicarboxylate transporter 2/3/5